MPLHQVIDQTFIIVIQEQIMKGLVLHNFGLIKLKEIQQLVPMDKQFIHL